MAIGNVLLGLGLVCSLVGVIAGALFALSEELAVGQISCVEGSLSDANSTNCIGEVVQATTGGDCAIGRIGILTAKYDPACAADTPYALNPLIPTFEGSVLEFPLLFPSQTNLAGIPGAPEFEDCDSYFVAGGQVSTFAGVAFNGGVTTGISGFKSAVKGQYDNNIDSIIPGLNLAFAGLAPTLVGAFAANVPGFPVLGNLDDSLPGNLTAVSIINAQAGVVSPLQGIALLLSGAIGFSGLSSGSIIAAVAAGLLVGTSPEVVDGGVLTIPETGSFWVQFNNQTGPNPVLCGPTIPCSYADVIESAAAGLGDASLMQASAAIKSFEESAGGRAALKSAANAINPGANAASFIAGLKGAIADADAVEPSNIFEQILFNSSALGSVFAASCGAANPGSTSCSFVEFIEASSAGTETKAEARALINLAALYSGFEGLPLTTTSAIASAILASGAGISLSQVLGALYQLEEYTGNPSEEQVLTDLKQKCQNHEQDLMAVGTASATIPTGVGFLGVGLLLAVANKALLSANGNTKKIAIAAGLISVIGVILIVAGLLLVFFAPLYSNLGGGGETEDNSVGFALGIGFTYVALLAAMGSTGALLLLISGFLTQPTDESVAIMKP